MDKIEQALTAVMDSVPDATLVALLGLDGVNVQMNRDEGWQALDPQMIEVEIAALAEAVQRTSLRLGPEASPQFFVSTTRANLMGLMLDPDYVLVLAMNPTGSLDRAQQALAQARETLQHLNP
ncbi:MAG: hypothetical protein JXA37_08355 [Chloroflexia bacterium]|nr:hypothetical protein [Chloroflexia bacterium]